MNLELELVIPIEQGSQPQSLPVSPRQAGERETFIVKGRRAFRFALTAVIGRGKLEAG